MLLIMGLGMQMVAWPTELCEMLAARGFHVVRFDNRDVGRSSQIEGPALRTWQLLRRSATGAAYTLDDMADDAAGLVEQLGHADAHVVGASMGGMIAQSLAARHPDRVRSLTSMMSTTGQRWRGQPAMRVLPFFLSRPPRDRDEAIERMVRLFRTIGSPAFGLDEDALRATIALSLDRAQGDGSGASRQLAAIFASGDRTVGLRSITAPTLVLHGTADRMVRPSGGRATARAIPGARLELIDGLGHDLPRGAWPTIVDAIATHAEAADAARAKRRPDARPGGGLSRPPAGGRSHVRSSARPWRSCE